VFGELDKPSLRDITDMNWREIAVLGPLLLLTIGFGIYPSPVLDVTAQSVKKLVANYEAAIKTTTALLAQ
jgi:NADH-quinone oxidoreductase subunit M